MIQRCDRVHLAGEAIAEALAGNLDGHVATHARIAGAIHLTHAACANSREDFVRAEAIADESGI